MTKLYVPRKVVASSVLVGLTGLLGYLWIDVLRSAAVTPGEVAATGALSMGVVAALWGVVRNRVWGRWLGLAVAVSGMVAYGTLELVLSASHSASGAASWPLLLAAGFGALFVSLLGSGMAGRYELASSNASPWRVRDGRVATLNWTPILALAAAPMLLMFSLFGTLDGMFHACGARMAAGLATFAILGGVSLLLRQRVAGALLLIVAGALATFAAVDLLSLPSSSAFYFSVHRGRMFLAANFVPAIAAAAISIVILARPIARSLFGRSA